MRKKYRQRKPIPGQLFLPMRGYEGSLSPLCPITTPLFLPMRGYEIHPDRPEKPTVPVISPHEGL